MEILIFTGVFGSILVWLTMIRPYAVKHGQGYTTGANLFVAAWIDWEQSKEVAGERGDSGMLIICRLFLGLNLLVVAGFLLLVIV